MSCVSRFVYATSVYVCACVCVCVCMCVVVVGFANRIEFALPMFFFSFVNKPSVRF